MEKNFYQKQGVVYTGPFCLVMDTIGMMIQSSKNPYDLPIIPRLKTSLGVDHLPPFVGCCILGRTFVIINDPNALEDIYVKKNSVYTKHELERQFGPPFLYNNILNMETDHPQYSIKKKVLSSAFYKQKV